MPAASVIRLEIESALAHRIPYALTPAPRIVREMVSTGIAAVDSLLQGGLPIGAISELVGPACSGRTSLALSVAAAVTQAEKATAWIDVSNAFDPVSAAAAGIALNRLLWVRCGAVARAPRSPTQPFSLPAQYLQPKAVEKGLHGGSFGPHPRTEVKGLPHGVAELLHPEPRCAGPQRRNRVKRESFSQACAIATSPIQSTAFCTSWTRLEQALRSTDQLLQSGGFSVIVLDMGSLAPEVVSRVPLATWFRYRAAAERTQSVIVLVTPHPSTKSAAGLVLRLQPAVPPSDQSVFTGAGHGAEVVRRRFCEEPPRKPPHFASSARWQSRASWAGIR